MPIENVTDTSSLTLIADRARSSLQMLFVGDSLSMPVHWYYRSADIWRAFPPDGIQSLSAAPDNHPSSIMSLHSTSGGGRSNRQLNATQQIVGDVILKGKAKYWNQNQVHYHHGLAAGENTLNTWCAHLLLNWMSERVCADSIDKNTDKSFDENFDGNKAIDPESIYDMKNWLNHYVEFMTAEPARHPDIYAESYHRGFFANLVTGLSVEECGANTHDTPSMGALVTVAPLALALIK